jgi:uncharacterized protein (DUF2062 family)
MRSILPSREKLLQTPGARRLEHWLSDPQYWVTSRRSTSRAAAIGLFWAWLPVPAVTLVAALSACLLRANIPVSAALVWLNNPLTIAPLTWFSYLTGTQLLGTRHQGFPTGDWQFSGEWIASTLVTIWKPLLFGAFSLAIASALTGFVLTQLCWRARHWLQRRNAC